MLSEDVAKKVAELLAEEAEKARLKNEALIKERYEKRVLSEAYDVIRCTHIDDALDRKDIEEAFSLIYTPGKYYYLRCKDSELNEKLWKHYGYTIISEQVMIKRKHLPGYITETVNKDIPEPPVFAKFIYDKNYTLLKDNFCPKNSNVWFINEKLKDRIDKLIELIKIKIDIQEEEKRIEEEKELNESFTLFINRKGDVPNRGGRNTMYPNAYDVLCMNKIIHCYNTSKIFEDKFWSYIDSNGGFSKCPTCGNAPNIERRAELGAFPQTDCCTANGNAIYRSTGLFPKDKSDHHPIYVIHCCDFLYDFSSKKKYILASKTCNHINVKKFDVKYKHLNYHKITVFDYDGLKNGGVVYSEYNPDDPYGEKAKKEKERKETEATIAELQSRLQLL